MENGFVGNRWAVVGFDYDTAKALIAAIEHSTIDKDVLRRKQTTRELETEFTDGTILRWVPAIPNSKGCRFNKMWCDKNIDIKIFQNIILPCYMGREEDIIWV